MYLIDVCEEVLKNVGACVRAARQKQGLSQRELAKRAGVHRTYIGMVERAERNISLMNIEKIARGLDVSVRALLKGL